MKRYLALLLAGAMAFSAAACGSAGEYAEASTELNILMPENYISDKLIADFEEINGCTVNFTYTDSVAERAEKVKTANGEYDLVLVNDGYVASLIEENHIGKFSHNELPNTSALNEVFWGSKSYCIPYLMNYVYVVYDSEDCPMEITRYNDLLDPALKGKVAVPEDERELLMMALAAQGYAPNSVEESEVAKAYEWLVKLDENDVIYGDAKGALLDDTVDVAVVYDRVAAEVMAKDPAIRIAPFAKDKIRAEIDVFVIPEKAAHGDLAERFLNYICDPEVMAENLKEYPYSCPNVVALELVSKEYKNKKERQFDYAENVYFRKDISEARNVYEAYFEKLKELKLQ